jgi:glycosyltransferase involved in cell wall biosynthesis
MLGTYKNIDRFQEHPSEAAVDAVLPTLDAEKYLERTLDAMYREVPIKHLYVLDGGSNDRTLEILKQYPRVDLEVIPDLTQGKGLELLINKVTTPWFVFVDCAKVPAIGWYDEMTKHADQYDFMGSKRIVHYEFEREDPTTTDVNKRPLGGPWLIRTEAAKAYKVDDDYVWRVTDIVLRKAIEKSSYVYGCVPTTSHICYITEGERYPSDEKRRGSGLVFKEPEFVIANEQNMKHRMEITAKAVVKYLTPNEARYFLNDHWFLMINDLDREWIRMTNPTWLPFLDQWKRHRLFQAKLKRIIYRWYKRAMKETETRIEKVVKRDAV